MALIVNGTKIVLFFQTQITLQVNIFKYLLSD